MTRIDLKVPYSEKDEAKKLGARWDSTSKTWFVPDSVDPSAFKRWLPDHPTINVKADSYTIVQTEESCWKCGELTRVHGFLLPAGHRTLEYVDDGISEWYKHREAAMVFYVTDLFPAITEQIRAITRHYFEDFSKTTNSSYWMNHCESCSMKQGDFNLYCEPGGAFLPIDDHAVARIRSQVVRASFGCRGSTAYGGLIGDI